ncbi:unnamed protein product, partial [Mesorhabditis spiculigera]
MKKLCPCGWPECLAGPFKPDRIFCGRFSVPSRERGRRRRAAAHRAQHPGAHPGSSTPAPPLPDRPRGGHAVRGAAADAGDQPDALLAGAAPDHHDDDGDKKGAAAL